MKTIYYKNHKNIIHARLREAREAQGMSQEQLAAKLQLLHISIDQRAISKIERDERLVTDYELKYLCRVLNVKESWLLESED